MSDHLTEAVERLRVLVAFHDTCGECHAEISMPVEHARALLARCEVQPEVSEVEDPRESALTDDERNPTISLPPPEAMNGYSDQFGGEDYP